MNYECIVEGCNKLVFSCGYCQKHYTQIKKYGEIRRTIYDLNEIIVYENYAEMILYNKQCQEIARTIIDSEDIDKIKGIKWSIRIDKGYIYGLVDGKKNELHRFIMDAPKEILVDHISRNKLDNRKSNLRFCNYSQNTINRNMQINNTSGITGVYLIKISNKWHSTIKFNRTLINLGCYECFQDAVIARLKAELKYFGKDFAPQRHLFEQYSVL